LYEKCNLFNYTGHKHISENLFLKPLLGMYVVSSLFGSRVTAAATISSTSRKLDSSVSKYGNGKQHHARIPEGKVVEEMPLAATVKSQMLRFLRRNKNTRAARCESPARSSRKKGGGDTAMVIPNKRVSVLVDSPSAHNNGMVTVAEPYAMALGAAVAVKAASSGSKHETTKKQASSTTQRAKEGGHRSSSQARRHRTQVMQ
jgi:hypothetical protein